jgi:hypothetical protein
MFGKYEILGESTRKHGSINIYRAKERNLEPEASTYLYYFDCLKTRMIRFVVHYLLCILLLSQEADCRSWKDVKLIHKVSPRNINTLDDQRERTESDVYYEEEPTPVDSPPVDITVTNVVDQYHSNDVPQVIPPGYFNYDTSENSKYGPGAIFTFLFFTFPLNVSYLT